MRILKSLPSRVAEIAEDKGIDPGDIEIWFADEARIGQKNKITRRWAKRGTRPSAPQDQRTASTCIFGAICPKDGKGAALVLPACNTQRLSFGSSVFGLPWLIVSEDSIEHCEEFSGDGDEGDHPGFAVGDKSITEGFKLRVVAGSDHGTDEQHRAHAGPSAANEALAAPLA